MSQNIRSRRRYLIRYEESFAEGRIPSQLIDARIKGLGDWQGEMLSRLRALIKQADLGIVEEWEWRRTPVWSHNGLVCAGETCESW